MALVTFTKFVKFSIEKIKTKDKQLKIEQFSSDPVEW